MKFTVSFILASVLAITEYSSAQSMSCYGPANAGASVSEYQSVAAAVCNGANSASRFLHCQQRCCVFLEAWYTGPGARNHCWNAFNNLIGGCVQAQGRNGGEWHLDGQNYFIQSNWNCGLSAAKIDDVNKAVNGTVAEA